MSQHTSINEADATKMSLAYKWNMLVCYTHQQKWLILIFDIFSVKMKCKNFLTTKIMAYIVMSVKMIDVICFIFPFPFLLF